MKQKLHDIVMNEKFNKWLKWINFVVMGITVVSHFVHGNYSAAFGWALAMMWCSNYFMVSGYLETTRELLDGAMEGWGKCVDFVSDLNDKATEATPISEEAQPKP